MIKESITKFIKDNNFLRKKVLKFFVLLHNYSYSQIKRFLTAPGEIHPKHRIMNYHKFFIDNISEANIVLDLGCGNGAVADDVSKKAKKVIGIDISEENIRMAKEKYQKKNLKFIQGDATSYDFSELDIQKFDEVILSNVLEHIKDRIIFLNNLHKLTDIILLRVPMLNRDWLTVYKKEKGYKYMLDSTHFIEYTPEDLKKELESTGWMIKKYSVQFGEAWAVIIEK